MRAGLLVVAALSIPVLAPDWAAAQSPPPAPGTRRATTVAAIVAYPVFFHTQPVRVRGTLVARDGRTYLRAGDADLLVAGADDAGPGPAASEVEATGTFVDVGRLEPGDPRLAGLDIAALWGQVGRTWPGVGELKLLRIDATAVAEPFAAPSLRALALDPTRYADQRVTVSGRFRGFNLYGDLPDAPARIKHAFVLQSADAAVWVVGLQPKGSGFTLNVNARVDTNRWLDVSGVVAVVRGLPVIEGQLVSMGKAPVEAAPAEPVARVPAVGPRPEVVFSLPARDETEVAPTASVRIQFSRDLDPKSIAGGVRVAYLPSPGTPTSGPAPGAPVEFTTQYNQGLKVLQIRFAAPLEPFRSVEVELRDTLRAIDGPALVPWTMRFTVGG